MRIPSLSALSLSMLLGGCPQTPAPCDDGDQDGYGAGAERSECLYEGLDCDDGDATVNPGAQELCNALDDDCDGLVDDEDDGVAGQSLWYLDDDADGFGDPGASLLACAQPAGASDDRSDCDDGDPAVNPRAQELCNGVDDDCDGAVDHEDDSIADAPTWYADEDGDGYGDPEQPVSACSQPDGYVEDDSDCHDGDDEVHPGAFDRTDGRDNDCDGDVDIVWLDGGKGRLLGEAAGDRAGASLARVGDFDGDGLDDLLVGGDEADTLASASGVAWLLSSAALPTEGGSLSLGEAALVLESEEAGAGLACDLDRLPDADGDGRADLLVGAWAWGSTGAAFVVPSRLTGRQDVERAAHSVLLGEEYSRAGTRVAGGDFDGDGAPDVLVGGWMRGDEAGIAWLVHGVVPGSFSLAEADTIIEGRAPGQALGWEVANAGDVDGDGLEDWLVTEPWAHDYETGEVHLFRGGSVGVLSTGEAEATMYGRYENNHLGYRVAGGGDIDRDGYGDMLLAARDYGVEQGRVYVMLGPKSGSMCVCGGSDGSLIGAQDYDGLGSSLAFGDVNGDGLSDALFGARDADRAGADSGAAYLWLGPMGGGTRWADEVDARFFGAAEDSELGSSVALLPDLNGDGREELALGARSDEMVGVDAGAVFLLLAPVARW
jgi:hypothetical protein